MNISATVTPGIYIGGLAGKNNSGNIKNCTVTGSVTASGDDAGGITGRNEAVISNCHADCEVTGYRSVGGVTGVNTGTITSSYSTGNVYGDYDYVGGIAGSNEPGKVTNCYSTGDVNVGGFSGNQSGYQSEENVDCFWDAEKDGLEDTKPGDIIDGAAGKSTVDMQKIATFLDAGWDFIGESDNGDLDTWRLCVDGSGYPGLAWEYARRGDFVCGDGVDMDDFAYFSARDYCDGCGGIFRTWCDKYWSSRCWRSAGGGVVDLELFAKLASSWLDVGCYNCDGGDVTGDGNVGTDDLCKIAEQWLCSASDNWERCDMDGDGIVGDSDFDIWIFYWLWE